MHYILMEQKTILRCKNNKTNNKYILIKELFILLFLKQFLKFLVYINMINLYLTYQEY